MPTKVTKNSNSKNEKLPFCPQKKLRKLFAEFWLKRESAYLTASRTRISLSSNPSSKSRRNMLAPSLFATAGFS